MYNIIQVAAQASRRAIAFGPFNDTGSSAGPVKPSQRPIKHEIHTLGHLKKPSMRKPYMTDCQGAIKCISWKTIIELLT